MAEKEKLVEAVRTKVDPLAEREAEREAVANACDDLQGHILLTRDLPGAKAGDKITKGHRLWPQARLLLYHGDAVREEPKPEIGTMGSLPSIL